MNDYVPSTDEVRESHEFAVQQVTGCASGRGLAEFDRWLAGALADAWDEGADAADVAATGDAQMMPNPYRVEGEGKTP